MISGTTMHTPCEAQGTAALAYPVAPQAEAASALHYSLNEL